MNDFERNKREIRDTGLRLFAAHGFEAVGIRQIALEAGISISSIYHYWPSKEELLFEVMVEATTRLHSDAVRSVAAFRTPVEQLVTLVKVHIAHQTRNSVQSTVVDSEMRSLSSDNRDALLSLRDGYQQLWIDILRAGEADGSFVLRDLHATCLAMLDMCNGISRWYKSDGASSISELADEYSRMILRMIGAECPLVDALPVVELDFELQESAPPLSARIRSVDASNLN